MSDQIEQPNTEQPNAEAGQTAEPTTTEPKPFATFPDAKSFNQKVSREARKLMNEQAKAQGFDDWQHMQESLAALRQPPAKQETPENPQEGQQATPTQPAAQSATDEAKRLRMALNVASELGLPTVLVSRLQGDTPEEMKADAEQLLGVIQQPQRGPGIPPAPTQNRPVTFTRAQLSDPKFVREHMEEIRRAGREGRIVNS